MPPAARRPRRRSRDDVSQSEEAAERGAVSVAFDTLKFVERLENGGFSHAQAKAAAEAFADATGEQLATKADLREALAAQKADFRAEIASVKADVLVLKWMMGFILAFQVGIFAKLFMR